MEDKYLTSATVWMIVWILIGISLTLGSALLLIRSLFPELSQRCAARCQRPLAPVLTGVATVALLIAVVAGLQRIGPPGQVLSILLFAAALCTALLGAGGLLQRLCVRFSQPGEDPTAWHTQRRAATVLVLAWLLPVAGTFLLFPLSLLCGLGCVILSLRNTAPAAQS